MNVNQAIIYLQKLIKNNPDAAEYNVYLNKHENALDILNELDSDKYGRYVIFLNKKTVIDKENLELLEE